MFISPCFQQQGQGREGMREESLGLKGSRVTIGCLHSLCPLSSPPSQPLPSHLEGVGWVSYKGNPPRREVCNTETYFEGRNKPIEVMADQRLLEAETPWGGGPWDEARNSLRNWNHILTDQAMPCKQVFLSHQGNGKDIDVKGRLLVSLQYRAIKKDFVRGRFIVRTERLHATIFS